MLTQSELKGMFSYDAETGYFKRLSCISTRFKTGSIAGGKNFNGYIIITIKGKRHRAHRLVWLYCYGVFPDDYIDHINGDKEDNRLMNLRNVTNKDNGKNQKLSKTNSSGVTGVCWHNRDKKWVAQIRVNDKNKYLGGFSDVGDAIKAREIANVEYGYHPNHGRR